jgi:hypothetical protein
MAKPRITIDNVPLQLLSIIVVTFIYYYGSLNNFFYADDFFWLDRVKHLTGNWASIFTLENRYFTPLTYLSFFVNYKLFGLNAFFYHLQDVIVHALNGTLLYVLTYLVSRNKLTSFIAAIAFVTSFSMLITVLWPSARTDLIMVFFSLATIIAFIRTRENRYKFVPVLLYVLALCAKGTALVIPVVLFLLTSRAKSLKSRIGELLPYLVINVAYASLLTMINSFGTKKFVTAQNMVSFTNYVRSLPTLIVPERYLAGAGTSILVVICVIIIITMIGLTTWLSDVTARIGAALAIFGLLPLLFTRDYVLAGSKAAPIHLISSPSNRVYLSCVGISLVYAVLFEKLLSSDKRLSVRIMSVLFLVSLLGVNYYELGLSNKIWKKGTAGVKNDMVMLDKNAPMLTENSVLLLFNFEGSTGFSTAMVHTLYDLKAFEVHTLDGRYNAELTNVSRSPLNNSQYAFNAANVKIIIDCPGHPYPDRLVADGNLTLQNVLADYRELYEATSAAKAEPLRKRLEHNMLEFRTVLNECSP